MTINAALPSSVQAMALDGFDGPEAIRPPQQKLMPLAVDLNLDRAAMAPATCKDLV